MDKQPEVILLATENVIADIDRFTDPDIAKELFELFECRMLSEIGRTEENKKYLEYDSENDFIKYELPSLSDLQAKLNYDIRIMAKEINFLHTTTPIYFHKLIIKRLESYLADLEKIVESEQTLIDKIIEKNKTKSYVRYTEGEKIVSTYTTDDKISLAMIESYNRIDYFDFFKSLISFFKDKISIFTEGINKKPVEQHKGKGIDVFSIELTINDLCGNNLNKFYQVCDHYSKLRAFPDKEDYILIKKKEGEYYWEGLGSNVIPILGQFIYELVEARILKVRKNNAAIARVFIPFFHLDNDYKNNKANSDQIKDHENLSNYFPYIKKVMKTE